jgi:hypothetical protein
MTTYEPGTVAIATVQGVPNVKVVRVEGSLVNAPWVTTEKLPGCGSWHYESDVTDVRPLVVLDLDDPSLSGNYGARVANLIDHLRDGTAIAKHLADQIEAQTRPPRIPEPGWGEKVRSRAGDDPKTYKWLRYTTNPNVQDQWVSEFCSPRPWSDLIDPVLVREGVES